MTKSINNKKNKKLIITKDSSQNQKIVFCAEYLNKMQALMENICKIDQLQQKVFTKLRVVSDFSTLNIQSAIKIKKHNYAIEPIADEGTNILEFVIPSSTKKNGGM